MTAMRTYRKSLSDTNKKPLPPKSSASQLLEKLRQAKLTKEGP
jgi:hypothetical protein